MITHVEPVGIVRSITRFPVKSMAGESLQHVFLSPDGLTGDRAYAFESSNAPAGMLRLTGPQRRSMLQCRARTSEDGSVRVTTPAGATFNVHSPELLRHFAVPGQYRLTHSARPQTDVRPVSIHTLHDMDGLSRSFGSDVDPRRFRSNFVLETETPLSSGSVVTLGPEACLAILEPIPRCRFITYAPDSPIEEESLFGLMRHLDGRTGGRMGTYARVLIPGNIRVGDVVSLTSSRASNSA